MNCSEAESLLAAQLDGELDAAAAAALDVHLVGCAACSAERASLLGLRARIAAVAPYHRAPPELRDAALHLAGGAEAGSWLPLRDAPRRRAFAAGLVAGGAAVAAGWLGATAWLGRQADGDLARLLVDAHVRATLAEHRIDVASSDQHAVKPWLSARLDYAPPVVEAPIAGVELVGARIESIERQRVATLVYRYRAHSIDVFVRPGAAPDSVQTIRGFNVAQASGGEMEWRAVSDASAEILVPLVRRLARPAGAG
jgi:anti-sigma factor RsiW